MATTKKKEEFARSIEGAEVKQVLRQMVENPKYNTRSTYSADSKSYPDNLIPFVDKHMAYLSLHQATDVHQYLANLQLITKVR